ncbi:MAG TPA: hypothetical protein VKI65_10370, partial [Gemmataceae bacterium]|nr:hypothetical protein [Gemmataceae bacterium]
MVFQLVHASTPSTNAARQQKSRDKGRGFSSHAPVYLLASITDESALAACGSVNNSLRKIGTS